MTTMIENETMVSEDAPEGGSRTKVLVAGGVAGALVLGAAGYLLLSGGSSDDESFAVVKHRAPKVAAAKNTTQKSVQPTTKLPPATSVKIGRDPFAALYVVPAAPAAGAGTSATSTSTSTSTSSPSTAGTATGAPYSITLTKVTKDKGGAVLYTFTIGKVAKTVLPAQRFGKYGELVVLTGVLNNKGAVTGAVLQVGDDNPVEAAIGSRLTVL